MEKASDNNALKRHLSFEKEWITGRIRCFDMSGKELSAQFNFHERAWEECLNECLEAEFLPFIFVAVQPQFMPSELIEISDETDIILRDEAAEYDILITAKGARERIAAAIKRRRLGVINVGEAAFLLARQDGARLNTYRKLIEDAFIKTDIYFIEQEPPRLTIDATARMAWLYANGMKHPGYAINDKRAFTTPKSINSWLDKIDKEGFMPRIQSTSQPTTPPTPPVVAESASGGGTARVWTPERKEAARVMMNEYRGQGVKAFAAKTAAAFDVTPTRLREVLNAKPKKAPAKKPKGVWGI